MVEYIERGVLIENLNKFAPEHYSSLINMLITKQPTADVVSKEQYDDLYSKYCNLAKILNDKLPPVVEMVNNADVGWTYNTNIPHATFDIYEDGEKYCKGIVFEKCGTKATTHFDRIKAMSVEEMARENIYFIPDCRFAHYTGLSGKYRKTSAEVIQDNIEYLESEVAE